MVLEAHMKTSKELLELLRTNWQRSYTLKELSELGYGKPATLNSRLDKMRNVYRVSRGVYQFTPWERDNAKPLRPAVKKLLIENPNILLNELVSKTNSTPDSVRSAIQGLRDEGLCIIRESSYRLVE